MTTYLVIYIVSAALIAGWMFATFHRDGVTEPFEWGSDLRFSIFLALIFAVAGPVAVYLFWVFGAAAHGWTLIPDRTA